MKPSDTGHEIRTYSIDCILWPVADSEAPEQASREQLVQVDPRGAGQPRRIASYIIFGSN